MALIKYESFETATSTGTNFYGTWWRGLTFTATSDHSIDRIVLKLYKEGSPDDLTINVFLADDDHKPTGESLSTGSLAAGDIPDAEQSVTVSLSSFDVTDGQEYAVILSSPGSDSSNDIHLRYNSGGGYVGGVQLRSSDSGSTWWVYADNDAYFEIWCDVVGPTPTPPVAEINKDAFSGYHCFIEQYQKRRIAGLLPFMLPDGSLFAE